MQGVARFFRVICDVRVVYALCGMTLSVVAHELLHLLVHIGEVQAVRVFPEWFVVVELELTAASSGVYAWEEFAAYGLSTAVLLVTLHDVYSIHDSRSKAATRRDLSIDEFDDAELHDFAVRAKII